MDWFSTIIGFLAGLGTGYSLKIAVDSRKSKRHATAEASDNGTATVQSENKVGGDMAGRDIKK